MQLLWMKPFNQQNARFLSTKLWTMLAKLIQGRNWRGLELLIFHCFCESSNLGATVHCFYYSLNRPIGYREVLLRNLLSWGQRITLLWLDDGIHLILRESSDSVNKCFDFLCLVRVQTIFLKSMDTKSHSFKPVSFLRLFFMFRPGIRGLDGFVIAQIIFF